MSRISSLKFPIIHDIKDNLLGYLFHLTWAINIARTIFNSIQNCTPLSQQKRNIHKTQSATKNSSVGKP